MFLLATYEYVPVFHNDAIYSANVHVELYQKPSGNPESREFSFMPFARSLIVDINSDSQEC